jgi:hypothetical protein
MNRIALIVACLLLLSGCISKEAVRMPTALENYSGDKAGQVFGTLGTFPRTPFSSVTIFFRQVGSKDSGRFFFAYDSILGGPQVDVVESKARGTIFVGRLPAGNYELFQVNFFINRGQFGTTTFASRKEFSIPFKVEKGKSTYLGEFIAYDTTGKNFFNMTIPAGGYYVVTDKSQRDIAILSKKPGANPTWPILKSVVSPEAVKLPFFQVSAE